MASRVYSQSIFVGNISYQTNDQQFHSFFDRACGHVRSARIIYDNRTQQSRGFGFVEFDTSIAYENALALDGSSFNGRKLKISPSKPQTNDTEPIVEQKTRVVHCKKEKYDVYIGRPSIWGNPFVIGRDGDKPERIRKYREWIMNQPELLERAKRELRGRTLACWCKPEACHGDILAEIADTD